MEQDGIWIRLNWRVDGSAGTIYVSRGQFGGEDNLRQFASDETPEAEADGDRW